MSVNKVFNGTPAKNRVHKVSDISVPASQTTIQPGVPCIVAGRPAVSLTASGNGTKTIANPVPGVTSLTYANGGAGLEADEASFAHDGTYEFAVTGATTSTADGTAVYITSAGALTLTSTSNTAFGKVDLPKDYRKKAGRAPVAIGA